MEKEAEQHATAGRPAGMDEVVGPRGAPVEESVVDGLRDYGRFRLLQRISNDFTYHAPKGDQLERYGAIRTLGRELAEAMVRFCPASRELSAALTRLEEAVMHANASIARNE